MLVHYHHYTGIYLSWIWRVFFTSTETFNHAMLRRTFAWSVLDANTKTKQMQFEFDDQCFGLVSQLPRFSTITIHCVVWVTSFTWIQYAGVNSADEQMKVQKKNKYILKLATVLICFSSPMSCQYHALFEATSWQQGMEGVGGCQISWYSLASASTCVILVTASSSIANVWSAFAW